MIPCFMALRPDSVSPNPGVQRAYCELEAERQSGGKYESFARAYMRAKFGLSLFHDETLSESRGQRHAI
jgi:hypothetical protein